MAQGVRGHLAVQAGISGQQTSAALMWGEVLGLASAVVVSIIGLLANPHSSIKAHATWLVFIFALAFAGFVAVGSSRFVRASWREWSGLSELARRPRMFASALGFYSATWLIAGASHWSLANALAPTPAELFPSLVIAVAVSWGFGVISIIAPAGLGVREGVLFIFVRGWMSQGDALLFVTLSRLLMFATEVLLLGTWMLLAFSGIIQRSATPNVERS